MIRILSYGQVPNSEIFDRGTAPVDVAAVVRPILEDVQKNGDEAL